MNSFSFSEDDEPRQLHCLDQEIGEENFGDWRGNSQEQTEFAEIEPENPILSEFDINIPTPELNQPNFNKPSLGLIEDNPEPNLEMPQKEDPNPNEKAQSTAETSFQEAHTFFEQTNISTTIVGDSGVQQKWRDENAPTLNEFLSIAANIYSPMLQHLKSILEKTKGYSAKTISNLDMYCLFLRIKLQQQKERLRIIKEGQLLTCKNLKDNELVQGVYIDEKIILTQMIIKNQIRKSDIENYCESLEESCNKVKLLLSKALENRTKKIDQIASQIERIQRIYNELNQMFSASSDQHQYDDWISKGDLRADRYLQRKYLQEREKLFLDLLKEIGQKIVTLLHSIFLKEEPIICSVLSKQMSRYRQLSNQLYKITPTNPQSTVQTNMQKITTELAQVLSIIIPVQWREQLPQNTQNQCEVLINQLHAHLQNQIFLPTVQISPGLILFSQSARWVSKNPSSQQGNVTTQNKQNKNTNFPEQATCQNLVSQKTINICNKQDQNMTVNVVLTSDRYLHLQHQEKIASLKLKRLKLSKKGTQSILLSERQHNLAALFVTPLYLGELTFPTEIMTDQFITAVLSSKK